MEDHCESNQDDIREDVKKWSNKNSLKVKPKVFSDKFYMGSKKKKLSKIASFFFFFLA